MRCVNNRAGLAVCLSMINIPKIATRKNDMKTKLGSLGGDSCVCMHILMYVYAYMLICMYTHTHIYI